MKTVDEIIDDILCREGGYVDDADDAGGATKHGISLRYAKGIGLDLDGDGDVDKDDIKAVTPAKAREFYKKDFFSGPRINVLPAELHAQMVDIAVNSGAGRAIILLQELLEKIRISRPEVAYGCIEPDGGIGPKTRVAAEKAVALLGGDEVGNMLASAREHYMRRLADADPRKRKYITAANGGPGGWVTRAREFRTDLGHA